MNWLLFIAIHTFIISLGVLFYAVTLMRANGSRYRRRVGLDSFPKRKCSKPEPTDFGGVNPAVRVHAVLGIFKPFRTLASNRH